MREPQARARGYFMEKGLANSTCRVFISPAKAPAAEITTWGKGENAAGPPCPSPAWLSAAGMQKLVGHHKDEPIPSGGRDVPGLGDSPWQSSGTQQTPARVRISHCSSTSRVDMLF